MALAWVFSLGIDFRFEVAFVLSVCLVAASCACVSTGRHGSCEDV